MATDEPRTVTPPTTNAAETEGHGIRPFAKPETDEEADVAGHVWRWAKPETDQEPETEGHSVKGNG